MLEMQACMPRSLLQLEAEEMYGAQSKAQVDVRVVELGDLALPLHRNGAVSVADRLRLSNSGHVQHFDAGGGGPVQRAGTDSREDACLSRQQLDGDQGAVVPRLQVQHQLLAGIEYEALGDEDAVVLHRLQPDHPALAKPRQHNFEARAVLPLVVVPRATAVVVDPMVPAVGHDLAGLVQEVVSLGHVLWEKWGVSIDPRAVIVQAVAARHEEQVQGGKSIRDSKPFRLPQVPGPILLVAVPEPFNKLVHLGDAQVARARQERAAHRVQLPPEHLSVSEFLVQDQLAQRVGLPLHRGLWLLGDLQEFAQGPVYRHESPDASASDLPVGWFVARGHLIVLAGAVVVEASQGVRPFAPNRHPPGVVRPIDTVRRGAEARTVDAGRAVAEHLVLEPWVRLVLVEYDAELRPEVELEVQHRAVHPMDAIRALRTPDIPHVRFMEEHHKAAPIDDDGARMTETFVVPPPRLACAVLHDDLVVHWPLHLPNDACTAVDNVPKEKRLPAGEPPHVSSRHILPLLVGLEHGANLVGAGPPLVVQKVRHLPLEPLGPGTLAARDGRGAQRRPQELLPAPLVGPHILLLALEPLAAHGDGGAQPDGA
eukprot:CAMPEP_0204523394 /NCGR_PEP_ID=MMETSP0661-20131031/6816_1 /ASSEMBLY_ACC=CAM_ASM_000606 /TAXON_ID=109239 /ORGANISM="Alexandrium margalefi, Strain AMGDE01CS-322" /LENGTH=596 /DNA_ID=CAMNT_0051529093 /DNA_START=146 /DNA_END=1932 /DNA_ORIENTATION=+